MSDSDLESSPLLLRTTVNPADLDFALAVQLIVAWAGEGEGEVKRLGWWRSDFVSEYGGEFLFAGLLPRTWRWAVFQAVRETARRKEAQLRAKTENPDRIHSLFHLGFEMDERMDERLSELKRSGVSPAEAMPELGRLVAEAWSPQAFAAWAQAQGSVEYSSTPAGRRIKGAVPESLPACVAQLAAALASPSELYPLPHYWRSA